jgi:hypothetical protein
MLPARWSGWHTTQPPCPTSSHPLLQVDVCIIAGGNGVEVQERKK